MARSIVWPQVAPPAEPAAPDPAAGLDVAGLAAAFGPDLARRMGLRVTAAADAAMDVATDDAVGLACIPLLPGADGLEALHIGCAPQVGALLLERLFGAPAATAAAARGADLLALPPGSASWAALCRTLASALATALAAAGRPVGGSPVLPARAVPLPDGPRLGLVLDVDGAACRILLLPQSARVAEAPPQVPDAAQFRAAARARVFEMELPVALRIAERRMSLQQAGALSVGDVIPIEPLPMPEVLAGGRRIARLPASAFTPATKPEEEQ
jgi:hypothetical protein